MSAFILRLIGVELILDSSLYHLALWSVSQSCFYFLYSTQWDLNLIYNLQIKICIQMNILFFVSSIDQFLQQFPKQHFCTFSWQHLIKHSYCFCTWANAKSIICWILKCILSECILTGHCLVKPHPVHHASSPIRISRAPKMQSYKTWRENCVSKRRDSAMANRFVIGCLGLKLCLEY